MDQSISTLYSECITFNSIYGCTDPLACNYDPNATNDDGSCDELSLFAGLIPENYSIHNIYPNPFNPIANIAYGLPEYTNVHIVVYDLTGRQVQSLINETQSPGYHNVDWNASSYPSGVCFVKMIAGDYINTQKVVLVK